MNDDKIKFYSVLSRFSLLQKSYALKFMVVTSFGFLIPLLTLIVYITITSSWNSNDNFNIFIFVSVATLFGMMAAFTLLYLLLSPLKLLLTRLRQYLNEEQKSKLPITFGDLAGQLMTDVQYLIEKLDLLNHSVKSSFLIDPLTGIPNRLAAEERLCQELARTRRDHNQILIALLDVVQLKNINDKFGHSLGDVCLTQIVETLSQSIRKGDWIARWGGDQFLMVLWNFNQTTPTGALKRIQQQSIKTPMGKLLHLNLSIGACKYEGNAGLDGESDLEALLLCVNKALSQVKQTGEGGIILN